MISELVFSREHRFFWNKNFPFITRLVKKLNLEKQTYVFQIDSLTEVERRAVVNEVGFRLFEWCLLHPELSSESVPDETLGSLVERAFRQHCRFLNIEYDPAVDHLSEDEIKEGRMICSHLLKYFREYEPGKEVVASPAFKGCGVLNFCAGDVLVDSTLYEVKSGERDYRHTDVKQLLVYSALANVEGQREISDIALLNPRRGTFASVPIREAIEMASGMSLQDAFLEIVNYIDVPEETA